MVKFVSTAKSCQVFYFPLNIYIAELCATFPFCYVIVCYIHRKDAETKPRSSVTAWRLSQTFRQKQLNTHHISKESFAACKAEKSSCAKLCIGADSSNRSSCTQSNGAAPAMERSSSSVLAMTQRHVEHLLKHQISGSHHTILFFTCLSFCCRRGKFRHRRRQKCGAGSLFDAGLIYLARSR
jgi:hypothetical protein